MQGGRENRSSTQTRRSAVHVQHVQQNQGRQGFVKNAAGRNEKLVRSPSEDCIQNEYRVER